MAEPIKLEGRHPSTQQVVQWFEYDHLPARSLANYVAMFCYETAREMVEELSDSPELTVGLRKLLEAKDCFVRAAIESERNKAK